MSLPATPGTGAVQPAAPQAAAETMPPSANSGDAWPAAGHPGAAAANPPSAAADSLTDIPILTEVLKHQPPPAESLTPLPGRPLLNVDDDDLNEPSLDDSFADLAQAGQASASSQTHSSDALSDKLVDRLVATASISASDQVIASLPDQPRSICGPGARTIWPRGIPNPPMPVPIIASAPAPAQPSPAKPAVAAPVAPVAPTIVRPSDDDLLQLEGRVWQRLERRLGQRIDVQLQFSLARLVDKAMEDTLAELKLGLRESLRTMLAESVRDEIRRDPAVSGGQPGAAADQHR